MNKKLIEAISQKAANFASNKVPTQNNTISKEYFNYFDTKFAELLISECADICTNFKYTEEGPSESAAYQRALCKFAIKEHFGLETPAPLSPKVIR